MDEFNIPLLILSALFLNSARLLGSAIKKDRVKNEMISAQVFASSLLLYLALS